LTEEDFFRSKIFIRC